MPNIRQSITGALTKAKISPLSLASFEEELRPTRVFLKLDWPHLLLRGNTTRSRLLKTALLVLTMTLLKPQIRLMTPAKNPVQEYLIQKLTVIMATPISSQMADKNLFVIGMDSYGFMELVTEVESEFSITFDEQDLVSIHMQTISGLTQLIEKKKLQ